MMQMQMMETSIGNELLEGEELIWSGRPAERGKSINSPARALRILGLIYGAIGLVFLIVGLIFSFAVFPPTDQSGSIAFLILGGIFFVLGASFFIVGQTVRFIPKSTYYAITNRRVIVLHGGRYLRVTSYDLRGINQVQRLERPDGSGDLIFSSISSLSASSTNGNNMYTAGRQATFSAIPNVRLAEQKLLSIMGRDMSRS